MKALLINGTTKQRMSISGFFMRFIYVFLKGENKTVKVRNRLDIPRIISLVDDFDTLIFFAPLYCDGVPSNLLYMMEEIEKNSKRKNHQVKVYVLTNCGFIEGKQTEGLFRVFQNFCTRCDFEWCGGLGIVGGVMLNVTRIMLYASTMLLAILLIYNGIETGVWLPLDVIETYLGFVASIVFFNAAAYCYMFSLISSINHRRQHGIRFTRALIFQILFVLIADIGFAILSMFCGGFWKGLNRKL